MTLERNPGEPGAARSQSGRVLVKLRGGDHLVIGLDAARDIAGVSHSTVVQNHALIAERTNRAHVVADEQDRASLLGDIAHLAQTLVLKGEIADRQHLINEQDFGLQMGRDGEGQAEIHAAGVVLDGSVDELVDFGECDDVVELPVDVGAFHTEDRAIEVNVFAAGKLVVKTGADFEQCADAAIDVGVSGGGLGDPREDLEERALAGAVAPDDPDYFALLDFEIQIFQSPDAGGFFFGRGLTAKGAKGPGEEHQRRYRAAYGRAAASRRWYTAWKGLQPEWRCFS